METIVLCELPDPEIEGLESFSPFCLKVHRALRLQKRPYERRFGRSPASFSSLNPLSKVPVLLIGDEVVCDSTRILQRLQVPGNGESKLWEDYADTTMAGFNAASRWACDKNWPRIKNAFFGAMPGPLRAFLPARFRRRVIRGLKIREIWDAGPDACWLRFSQMLDHLSQRAPEKGFWMGDTITVADLGIFSQLHSMRIALTPWQSEEIAKRAKLTAYLERVDRATSNDQQEQG